MRSRLTGRGGSSVETTDLLAPRRELHDLFKSLDDLLDVRDLVLVVSADCHLCDKARALLARLGLQFREVDLEDDEAAELARRGIPVVFFSVLVDGERVLAYGDITEAELRRAVPMESLA